MKTTKLILNSASPTDKKISTTISNANPESADATLETLAKKLNDLTDNTYISTSRVDTTELHTLTKD